MRILLLALLAFSISANSETSEPKTVKTDFIVKSLIRSCSEANVTAWVALAKKEGVFEKSEWPKVEMKREGNKVTSKAVDFAVTREGSEFQAAADGKTYSGKDVCEVMVKAHEAGKKNASLLKMIVPEADARDIFRANRLMGRAQVGVGAVAVVGGGIGAVLSSIPTVGTGTFVGTAVAGGGVIAIADARNTLNDLTALETMLNAQDLVISCTGTALSISGGGFKLEANKNYNNNNRRLSGTLHELRGNRRRLTSSNYKDHSNLGAWIHELAFSCNHSGDASTVMRNITDLRNREATLAERLLNGTEIMGAAPRSVLPARAE